MKMITTILIITVCLAATLVFSAEFVPGEMSLSQASETYGNGCVTVPQDSCPASCSVSGNYEVVECAESGSDSCYTSGDGSCGDCGLHSHANCSGSC